MQHGYRHEDLVAQLDAERLADDHGYAPGSIPAGTLLPAGVPGREYRFVPTSLHPDRRGGPAVEIDPLRVPAKNVLAVVRFGGPPGRERDAAEAWAFELTYYFTRGVGEAPVVVYEDGVYTCTGLMTTTHPWDSDEVVSFGGGESVYDLDWCMNAHRQNILRDMYPTRKYRYDGRDQDGE